MGTYINTSMHTTLNTSAFQYKLRLLSELLDNSLTKFLRTLPLAHGDRLHTRHQLLSLSKTVLINIYDDNWRRAGSVRSQQSNKTNRPSTADNHRVCKSESRAINSGKCDSQRLQKSTFLEGDVVGDAVQPGLRVGVVPAQSTVVRGC